MGVSLGVCHIRMLYVPKSESRDSDYESDDDQDPAIPGVKQERIKQEPRGHAIPQEGAVDKEAASIRRQLNKKRLNDWLKRASDLPSLGPAALDKASCVCLSQCHTIVAVVTVSWAAWL